jgi:hypothetical protein
VMLQAKMKTLCIICTWHNDGGVIQYAIGVVLCDFYLSMLYSV